MHASYNVAKYYERRKYVEGNAENGRATPDNGLWCVTIIANGHLVDDMNMTGNGLVDS